MELLIFAMVIMLVIVIKKQTRMEEMLHKLKPKGSDAKVRTENIKEKGGI